MSAVIVACVVVAWARSGHDPWSRHRLRHRWAAGVSTPRGASGPPSPLRRRRRRRRIATAELPRLAEAVARQLRAGASVEAGLSAAAELVGGGVGDSLAGALRAVGSGVPLAAALQEWADAERSGELDRFVATAILAGESGGAAAAPFDAVADRLRDRAELVDEVRSLTSQSRASAALLSGLPPFAAIGLATVEPETLAFLVATPLGLLCTGAAIGLTGTGWWWMRWLTSGVA